MEPIDRARPSARPNIEDRDRHVTRLDCAKNTICTGKVCYHHHLYPYGGKLAKSDGYSSTLVAFKPEAILDTFRY